MSINLHLSAEQEATLNNSGETIMTGESFSLYQTPSSVTYKILGEANIEDIFKAYCKWVNSFTDDETGAAHSNAHLVELERWLDFYTKKGYTIEFYAM